MLRTPRFSALILALNSLSSPLKNILELEELINKRLAKEPIGSDEDGKEI
jgi:hypothetical protein